MIRRNILCQEEINRLRRAAYPPDMMGSSVKGCFNFQLLPLIAFKGPNNAEPSFQLLRAFLCICHHPRNSKRINLQWKWWREGYSFLFAKLILVWRKIYAGRLENMLKKKPWLCLFSAAFAHMTFVDALIVGPQHIKL